jgi:amino acid transporter
MKPPSSSSTGLVRALGSWTAIAVVAGTVIGSGVFKKPQAVAESVPFSGVAALVWIVTGALALIGALAYAEVAVLYPRSGGNYVFLREGYGRLAGFLWGWVEFWIIRSASLAALATIFTESFVDVIANPALQERLGLPTGSTLGFWPQRALTVTVLVVLTAVNVRGVRWGGGLQLFITLVKVGSLLAIACLPFFFFVRPGPGGATAATANLQPMWPGSWTALSLTGIGSAFLAVLWAYHGWMNIAPIAEEVRDPQRNIPIALLGGVGIIIALYLGANLAYNLVIPQSQMAGLKDTTVATEFSRQLLGPLGAAAASAAVMCSVFGALNGNLLVGPRLLYAMGEDGLAPRALGEVHPRFGTPALAIWVLGGWSVFLVLSVAVLTETGALDPNKSHFDRLTDFAMFGAVIFETMAVLTIFVFRWRYPDAERPYRCPGYPWLPALYFVVPAFILGNMFYAHLDEAGAGVGIIALGALTYFGLGLNRTKPRPVSPDIDLAPAPRLAPPTEAIRPPTDEGLRP